MSFNTAWENFSRLIRLKDPPADHERAMRRYDSIYFLRIASDKGKSFYDV
jgi:hypothetical protein